MNRLRQKDGVDPARARAAHDVGQDPDMQVLFCRNPLKQIAIDPAYSIGG